MKVLGKEQREYQKRAKQGKNVFLKKKEEKKSRC